MDDVADPYEFRLLQMFKSCDKDECGLLSKENLRHLCEILELSDRGSALIAGLSENGNVDSREPHISFECFKEALLNFLGTELDGSATVPSNEITARPPHERSLVISDDRETFADSPSEASYREVSPKLVMGAKKYGRRSRPQAAHKIMDEFFLTDSAEDDEERTSQTNGMVQRSSSQSDIPASRRRRPVQYNGSKLKRCASLPTQKNIQPPVKALAKAAISGAKKEQSDQRKQLEQSVETLGGAGQSMMVHDIWNAHGSEVGSSYLACAQVFVVCERLGMHERVAESIAAEWFQKVNRRNRQAMNLPEFLELVSAIKGCDEMLPQQSNRSANDAAGPDPPALMDALPVHRIIDVWEQANISNGRGILLALGFDEAEVNLSQLHKALEEEHSSLEDDPQLLLLRASFALQTAELGMVRQQFRQLCDENVKLRADNKDANQRVAMLAVEIDERHASLEDSSKKKVSLLEQRHAGVVRDLTAQIANDREHWTNLTARLEARIKAFEQDELKLKAEVNFVRQENVDLDVKQQRLQRQITELLEQNISLNHEIADMADSTRSMDRSVVSVEKTVSVDHDVLQLVEKVSTLQMENTQLRDKNDELVAEVENLSFDINRLRLKNKKTGAVAEQPAEELLSADDGDSGGSQTATKRRGDSPSKVAITEESPRLGKLRKCVNPTLDAENGSDNSGDWVPLNSELQQEEKEAGAVKSKNLEEQPLKRNTSPGTEERCRELETSLEQMQRAYEDCEDYWQAKLTEERQLYEEEQKESDKKFVELMEKVREYEEQFSKDGRLSPIEEKDVLEQQYTDLETEAEDLRENLRKVYSEKATEIASLHLEIEDLRVRLGESVEILTGACELKNEAAHRHMDANSPANSPISYLWQQGTIQQPISNVRPSDGAQSSASSPSKRSNNNLSTSETTIFSTTAAELSTPALLSPIKKPVTAETKAPTVGAGADCETSSNTSEKSYTTHSVHHKSRTSSSSSGHEAGLSASPSGIKEELKRLKFFEISLKEQIKDLSLKRDGLVMELQQLHEARPVLAKAFTRTVHPSLIQRVDQLELRNRHLQNFIRQQSQYTESLMQQSWRQHQIELSELHNRIEAQGGLLAEQTQRLQNADILVKDLYVENSHLSATVQRLEHQRTRLTHMHQQPPTRQGLNGLPSMP